MGNNETKQGTSLHYKYKQKDVTQVNGAQEGSVFLNTCYFVAHD